MLTDLILRRAGDVKLRIEPFFAQWRGYPMGIGDEGAGAEHNIRFGDDRGETGLMSAQPAVIGGRERFKLGSPNISGCVPRPGDQEGGLFEDLANTGDARWQFGQFPVGGIQAGDQSGVKSAGRARPRERPGRRA